MTIESILFISNHRKELPVLSTSTTSVSLVRNKARCDITLYAVGGAAMVFGLKRNPEEQEVNQKAIESEQISPPPPCNHKAQERNRIKARKSSCALADSQDARRELSLSRRHPALLMSASTLTSGKLHSFIHFYCCLQRSTSTSILPGAFLTTATAQHLHDIFIGRPG